MTARGVCRVVRDGHIRFAVAIEIPDDRGPPEGLGRISQSELCVVGARRRQLIGDRSRTTPVARGGRDALPAGGDQHDEA